MDNQLENIQTKENSEREYVSVYRESKNIDYFFDEITRKYCCNVCPYKSNQRTSIVRHLRLHPGYKPFQCKICFKNYSFSSALKKHKSIHSEKSSKVSRMVTNAIKALEKGKGSSHAAIKRHIITNNKVDPDKIGLFIPHYLKKAVADKTLIQCTDTGANGSFKIARVKALSAKNRNDLK